MPPYKIRHFKSLPSTQDKAKEFSKKGLSNIAVIADKQTKGRGRFERKWHSSKGGLWMSILLNPKKTDNIQYLTFAAAVSVVNAIKKIAGLETNIKWPNDVHYKGKKLCGILTEGIFGKSNYVIVGIGLNINQPGFQDEITDTAISLKMVKHKSFEVNKFATEILDEFYFLFENYYNKNKNEGILRIWKRHCDTITKDVKVITKAKTLHGRATGIDKDCNLLLKLKNNRIIKIMEGDVTVRY